jgi:hypothetical protein
MQSLVKIRELVVTTREDKIEPDNSAIQAELIGPLTVGQIGSASDGSVHLVVSRLARHSLATG